MCLLAQFLCLTESGISHNSSNFLEISSCWDTGFGRPLYCHSQIFHHFLQILICYEFTVLFNFWFRICLICYVCQVKLPDWTMVRIPGVVRNTCDHRITVWSETPFDLKSMSKKHKTYFSVKLYLIFRIRNGMCWLWRTASIQNEPRNTIIWNNCFIIHRNRKCFR